MKNLFAIACLVAVFAVLAIEARPQSSDVTSAPARRSTTRMPGHPNNDLIRKGLIDKLCKQKYKPSSTPRPAGSSTTKLPATRSRSARQAAKYGANAPPPTFGPTCGDFDSLTFEELINRVKANLKPVGARQ